MGRGGGNSEECEIDHLELKGGELIQNPHRHRDGNLAWTTELVAVIQLRPSRAESVFDMTAVYIRSWRLPLMLVKKNLQPHLRLLQFVR